MKSTRREHDYGDEEFDWSIIAAVAFVVRCGDLYRYPLFLFPVAIACNFTLCHGLITL